MDKTFFDNNDDFESIVKTHLSNVTEVSLIPTGWTNYVYIAKTKDKQFIFRFPRNEFFAKAIETELDFTPLAKKRLSVGTTNLLRKSHKGRTFSMHELVDGYVLTDVLHKMTTAQIDMLAQDFADYIYELQNMQFSPSELQLPTSSQFLAELALVGDNGYDFSKLRRLGELDEQGILTHGDFNQGNVLVDQNFRLAAVLDYAFICWSCDINDLARMIGRLPPKFRLPLIKAFESRLEKQINLDDLDYLIDLWSYVDNDYIKYMKKHHPYIDLSAFS